MTRTAPSRHHDIAEDLRRQITTGRIKPGERLPSEAGLADRYKVSTVTLRSALTVLQGEGLVEKIHGKGNFVRRPPRKIVYVGGWGTLDPWTAADAALRVTVHTNLVQANGHLTTLLKVPTGSPLAEFSCVSHEGESPHRTGPHLYPARRGADRCAGRRLLVAGDGHAIRRPGLAAGEDLFVPNYRPDGRCGPGRWSWGLRRSMSVGCGRGGCCTPLLYRNGRPAGLTSLMTVSVSPVLRGGVDLGDQGLDAIGREQEAAVLLAAVGASRRSAPLVPCAPRAARPRQKPSRRSSISATTPRSLGTSLRRPLRPVRASAARGAGMNRIPARFLYCAPGRRAPAQFR
ncbi:regulatory GntR family protein [Streptomyces puniciscabiei]|uniref:Regulatory GntR family protein n=1 Tax=Streptomyces puniciscabiei TaxID=164348 RepID=A0A542UIS5_9ACTN|nr:regulatory GntR family protein [Streptomyces puniciscabiei]